MASCGKTIHKIWFKNLHIYQDQRYLILFFLSCLNYDHPLEDAMKNDKKP